MAYAAFGLGLLNKERSDDGGSGQYRYRRYCFEPILLNFMK